jgi:hypothetical protein
VKVTIAYKLTSSANLRTGNGGFARSNRAKEHRYIGFTAVTGNPPIPALPVVVTLTRQGPRLLDDDNLAFAFKSVRDGVAQALGIKDHDKRVTWRYAQLKGAYSITIEIESAV